jgi:HAD superfamily hydrolase (TIGR01490 family)
MPNKEKNKLAVFDIDGTIFRSNLQFELIQGLVFRKIFQKETRDRLVKSYRSWLENKINYETYKEKLIKYYKQELKGKKKADIVEAARDVIKFYHSRTFIYTSSLIEQLKETHKIVAISGSPIEIVQEYNKYLKFDDVFGTVYEVDKNVVYTGKEIYAPVANKAQALKTYVAQKGISLNGSVAIGDTESDVPMLEIVEKPIAFNADQKLYDYAKAKKWEVVVERKNVIYKI